MAKIKKIKKKLKSSPTSNKIIDESKKLLFEFQRSEPQDDSPRDNKAQDAQAQGECAQTPPVPFVENFQKLRPREDDTEDNRFHIAFLKADLNGMGKAFAKVGSMKDYKDMSEILNRWVCEGGIGRAIKEVCDGRDAEPSVYPLYAAGDDIFVACKVNDIVRTIHVLEYILDQINTELRAKDVKINKKYVQLQMRIGLDISYANQPIRYYYRRVDDAMESAKKACNIPELIQNRGSVTVCVEAMPLVMWDNAMWDVNEELDDAYGKARKEKSKFEEEKEILKEEYANNKTELDGYKKFREEYKKADYAIAFLEPPLQEQLNKYKKERGAAIKNDRVYKEKLETLKKEYEVTFNALDELNKPTDHFLWEDFLNDLAVLRYFIESVKDTSGMTGNKLSDRATMITTHLHNVLDVLETPYKDNGEDKDKQLIYMNRVLYAILPAHLTNIGSIGSEVPDRIKDEYNMELTLWHMLVKKLFTEGKKASDREFIDGERLERFITYLKLLLTFISPHFDVAIDKNVNDVYKNASKVAIDEKDMWLDKIILKELYDRNQGIQSKTLFEMFICKTSFATEKGTRFKEYSDYTPLTVVEKSMLYRFKQLLKREWPEEGRAFDLAIRMIENKEMNDKEAQKSRQEDVFDIKNGDSDAKRKAANAKARRTADERFDADSILRNEEYRMSWTEDFIDSLIVFYSYFNLRKQLKTIFGTKKRREEERNG
ncbi:MAG: hypothetical protein LBL49_00650 [Clostridiales Family XIII bacterium]|nr:hypothetical protein [Clostridiales Family XIII bacterium]